MALNPTTTNNTFDEWRLNTNATDVATGDVVLLTTVVKTSVVAATNELVTTRGDLALLDTGAKNSLVAAINEVSDTSFLNALLFGG